MRDSPEKEVEDYLHDTVTSSHECHAMRESQVGETESREEQREEIEGRSIVEGVEKLGRELDPAPLFR